jgi:DNA-binding transcriptional LysR family regulator
MALTWSWAHPIVGEEGAHDADNAIAVPTGPPAATDRVRAPSLPGRAEATMHVDLITLKLFVAVVEEQSLAKAAEREHIAASAVSKRIADLEKSVKVQLFRRHRTGLQATPAGQAFLHHARVLMRDLAQMDSEVGDYARGARGSVRVFANNSAMVQYLPGDLSRFLALHPLIRVDLEEAISPDIVRAVADDVAEIGIFGGNISAARLTVLPYRQDRLVVVVPAKHPLRKHASVRLGAVLPHDLVGMQEGSSIDALVVKAAADLGRPVKLRIRTAGFDAIGRMVQAGLGVAIMPELVAQSYRASLKIAAIPLQEPWAIRRLDLCVRDIASLSAAARLLVDHLTRKQGG